LSALTPVVAGGHKGMCLEATGWRTQRGLGLWLWITGLGIRAAIGALARRQAAGGAPGPFGDGDVAVGHPTSGGVDTRDEPHGPQQAQELYHMIARHAHILRQVSATGIAGLFAHLRIPPDQSVQPGGPRRPRRPHHPVKTDRKPHLTLSRHQSAHPLLPIWFCHPERMRGIPHAQPPRRRPDTVAAPFCRAPVGAKPGLSLTKTIVFARLQNEYSRSAGIGAANAQIAKVRPQRAPSLDFCRSRSFVVSSRANARDPSRPATQTLPWPVAAPFCRASFRAERVPAFCLPSTLGADHCLCPSRTEGSAGRAERYRVLPRRLLSSE